MRTFPARSSDRRRPPAAFTLVELLLVLALMAVVLFLALPTFQNLLQSSLQQEVNRLSGVIRLLRNEAVLGNTRYRLMLELKDNRYFVQRQNPDGSYDRLEEPKVLSPHAFPANLQIEDLVLLGRVYRTDETEPLPVLVDSSGYIDPFLLHFSLDGQDHTLRVAGFTGRVALEEGHAER